MIHLRIPKKTQIRTENNSNKSTQTVLGNWSIAGPFNNPDDPYTAYGGVRTGTGRANQIAFSGTHANVMYAIAPSGLFISTDTANTWQSTAPTMLSAHF